jgi:hypothetical protein
VAWLVAIPFLALTFQVFLILIAGLASTFD